MVARQIRIYTGIAVLLTALSSVVECGGGEIKDKDTLLWVDTSSKVAREDGSEAAPFKTISRALAKAPAVCVVRVRGGEYSENIALRDGVTLVGHGDTRPVLRGPDKNQPMVTMDGKCTLEFMRITGGGDGIFARLGSDVRILNCEVVDTHGDGIHFEKHLGGSGPRTSIHIEGCLVSGTRDGIDVEGNQGMVRKCRLIGNTDDGLDYDGDTDFAAVENEIRDNLDDGIEIRLRSRTLARIEGNVVTGNGEDGIEVINTPVEGRTANHVAMTGNTVRNNRRYGIAAVNHGTEDVKEGLAIRGIELMDNRVEGNLKEQIAGLIEAAPAGGMESASQETAAAETPQGVTTKPQYIAYLTGPGAGAGKAELQYSIRDGRVVKKKFVLAVKEGPPGTTWDVSVDGAVVGQITLGDGGGMNIEWATKHGSFPANFPEAAGPGSLITLGDAMAGKLRAATDTTDASLGRRWDESEGSSESPAEPQAEPQSITKLQYVAYLSGSAGSGKAELYYKIADGRRVKKQFQVTVTGGRPGATWNVSVDGVVIGRITLGAGGGLQMEWSTKYGSFPGNFPEGAGAGSVIALADALSGKLEPRTGQPLAGEDQKVEPEPPLSLEQPSDQSRPRDASPAPTSTSGNPLAQTVVVDAAGHGPRNGWGVESKPLETETARWAPLGAAKLEVGLERQMASDRTESHVPFAIDYAASRRVQFRLEPVLYSKVRLRNGKLMTGLGDLEMTATVLALPESRLAPAVAVAAEVKLPTARNSIVGSGKADYTGDLILSKRLAGCDTHVNLGYTFIGRPAGIRTQNVFVFAFAMERKYARFDAVGEIMGHTSALADGGDPDASDGSIAAPEIGGEELVGTLGGRYHLSDRVVLSVGLSYDNDHAVHVHPGLSVKLR